MLAHLIKDRTRHCENASNEAVNVALSIKFPGENITVALATPSTRVKWKPITLDNLFGGTKHKASRPSRTIEEEEEEAMEQAMAEALEDERPDDGAIEINSDEEYQ